MKRNRFYYVLALLVMAFALNSCNKDDKNDDVDPQENCNNLLTDYSNALTAFSSSPSEATCNDLFGSVEDYLDNCALVSDADREYYEGVLDSYDCSIFGK